MADRALNLDDFLSRFPASAPQPPSRHALNQRQAAVLVPIVRRPQPGLLLTQRSPAAAQHAGSGRLSGGAVDNTDATLTRRRPARSSGRGGGDPAGGGRGDRRPATGGRVTGFQVTPVVSIIPPDLHYHASQDGSLRGI